MSKSPSNASTQTINLAVAQKQTEKIALQPGQAIKIMVDGQPYTGQKTINGQAVRMVRKGDKLILEVEGQDQALVELSGFFPAEAATEQAVAQDLLGTIDAQALFEAGSSAQVASAELGALPTVSTPSWGTLIAQASTGAISATSAATTTAATTAATTTAAVTTTTAVAAGAVSAGAIAAGAALVAAAAIANSNDNDAPAADDVADTVPPTLSITSDASNLRTGETATITFTFSEDPGSSFTLADVVVTGGSLGEITGSGLTRTATFTPTPNVASGTASITVAAGTYTDAAGNAGGAGTTPAITFNTQSPTVQITSDVAAVKIGETAVITFTFSEDPGSTFTSEDVVVSGGTLGEITGSGLTRTATFTPAASTTAQASITVTSGSYANASENTGAAGTTPALSIDTAAPTLGISSNVAAVKVGETATITFTFSEDPGSTFTADDVAVTGGTLGAITGSGLTRTATFTPTPNLASGTASITVAGGTYTDAAGNTGGAGTTPTISIDTLAPTITIDSTLEGDNIVSASEDNDVVVSGTTTGVEDGRTVTVTLTDGTTEVTQTATVTNNTWSLTGGQLADISGLTSGDITVTANVTDLAGNPAVQANKTIALDNSVADLSDKSVQTVSNLIQNNTNIAGWGTWVANQWGNNVTTAPDGTTTADRLTATNAAADSINFHFLNLNGIEAETQYTYSVYAKADQQTNAAGFFFRFRPEGTASQSNAAAAQFDLSTGQLVSTDGTTDTSIESCGDGWYRLSMTFTSYQIINDPVLETRVGLNDGSPDNGHSVFLWGPQLVQGAQALPFVASGDTAGDVFAVSSTGGANISASELAMGVPLTLDLTGATLASGDTLSLVDATGRVFAETATPTAGLNTLVLNSESHSLHDGTHQLSVQITDAVGNTSQSQSLSVTVDTSAAETIGGLCTNDQIRAGGGNDTIHLSAGGNDTLIYRKEKSVAGWESQGGAGSGMDTVHDFSFAASGIDKLDLSGLLTGFQVAVGETNASVAERLYNGGYISLRQSGADLVLSVDHDGASGNTAQATDLITFKNRNLTDIDANGNVLQALEYLLENDILVLAQDHLTVTGGTGRAGAFVQGDTVQLSWDGSAQGYNNPNVTSVKVSLFGQEVTLSQQNGVWTGSLALGANFAGTSAPVVELGLTGGATNTLYAQETVVVNTQAISVASLSSVAVPTLVTNLFATDTDAAVAGWNATLNDNHAFTIDGSAQAVRMLSDGQPGNWSMSADTGAPIAGNTFTFSAWLWGTGSVDLYLVNADWEDGASTTFNLTSTPTRYSFTRTFNSDSTGVTAWFTAIDGSDQFMISGTQLEAGANMSAYVARNGTAGTVLTGDDLNAEELATGFAMNVDLTGQTLAAGQAVQIVDQHGNVWGESSTLTAGTGGVVSVLVKQSLDNVVADGSYQLASRLVNVQTGTAGAESTAELDVTVNTSAGETIGSFAGVNEVIRGGAGNDSIFLTTGGQDTVVFDVVAGQAANGTGGNGSDLITGFTFALGADKDAIVLDGLLSGYTATGNVNDDATDLADFFDLVEVGGNLEMTIDRDGSGGAHQHTLLATFANTSLSDIHVDATEWAALHHMLATSTLVVL